MKILFICGSLESGKDGVGDYVQQLSSELIKQGHHVLAMAINDKHTLNEHDEVRGSNDVSLHITRFPSVMPYRERYSKARRSADAFKPDFISFQFVPYSYQDKGLPFHILSFARELGATSQWHIMFHELWLGFSPGSPLKDRVIGFFQRRIIKSLVKQLKPILVTTSNPLYRRLLENNGIQCGILPLFSNISLAARNEAFISGVLQSLGIRDNERGDWTLSGIFGNIYPDSNLSAAISELQRKETAAGKKLACIGMGNLSDYAKGEFGRLEEEFGSGIRFIHLGTLSGGHISNVLQILDYGISCTPAEYIFKSGVFATMRLHDVRVIQPPHEQASENDAEILAYNSMLMAQPARHWGVEYVTGLFLGMLPEGHPVFTNATP